MPWEDDFHRYAGIHRYISDLIRVQIRSQRPNAAVSDIKAPSAVTGAFDGCSIIQSMPERYYGRLAAYSWLKNR